MRARTLGLLAAALLAGPLTANAGFVSTEEEKRFFGTFTFTEDEQAYLSSANGLLPATVDYRNGRLQGKRDFTQVGEDPELGFTDVLLKTEAFGDPDDPYLSERIDGPEVFPSDSGYFDNSKAGGRVYWSFADLQDSSGGRNGVFSGKFCFSRGPNCTTGSAPEPGTFALLGRGLAGLAASRRRKR